MFHGTTIQIDAQHEGGRPAIDTWQLLSPHTTGGGRTKCFKTTKLLIGGWEIKGKM